jgi:hypothetical protein
MRLRKPPIVSLVSGVLLLGTLALTGRSDRGSADSPTITFGDVTDRTISFRAAHVPPDDQVYFRARAFRTRDTLRAPRGLDEFYGYGAVIGGGESPSDSVTYSATHVVTSTADSGPGTLRDLLQTNPVHDATIRFGFLGPEVIELDSTVVVRASRFRLDAASGHPVTLTRSAPVCAWCDAYVEAPDHNPAYEGNPRCGVLRFDGAIGGDAGGFVFSAVVRGLRIEPKGTGSANQPDDADGIEIVNGAQRIIVDHCTIGPAGDEALAIGTGASWITVQYCVIHDNVKGVLVGDFGEPSGRVSVHRNLFFRNGERNTYTAGVWDWSQDRGIPHTAVGKYEFHNNVIYDWSNKGLSLFDRSAANVTGNWFIPGPTTHNRLTPTGVLHHALRLFGGRNCCEDGTPGSSDCCPEGALSHADRSLLYVGDNVWPVEERDDEDSAFRSHPFDVDGLVSDRSRWPRVSTPVLPLPEALAEVLSEAGTPHRSPADGARAEEVFLAARVTGLHRRVPSDQWVMAGGLEPNTPGVFEGRSCSDCDSPRAAWSDWFVSTTCYTLAATPLAPIVRRLDSTSVELAIDPGDGNPPWTRYAVREWCSGAWVQRDGSMGPRESWLRPDEWRAVRVRLPESGRCRTFAVKARNGDGIDTPFSERGRERAGS